MKIQFLFLFVLVQTIAFAQSSPVKKQKSSFCFQLYGGILEGHNGTSWQAHTIGGIRKQKWFGGLGAGFDHYFYRSLPFFISLNRYLKAGNNSFFLQADGGINYAWSPDLLIRGNELSDRLHPGFYWSGGAGFSASLGKRNAFLLNVSYSYKQLKETKELVNFCPNPPCEPSKEEYNYHLRRISLRIGWLFGGD